MCCRCCSVAQQKFWVFGTGTVLVVFGLLGTIWGPSWIDKIVFSELPLAPNSRTFDKWHKSPIPIYMYMYLYNWTNADDAWTKGIKPNFEMLGPYVYREERVKEDLVWNANKTVSFDGRRTWYWEPELSGGKEDDLITVPHLPSIAASFSMRDENTLMKYIFNTILNSNGGRLFATHTAAEWLFHGFYDEFLDFAMHNPMAPDIETNQFAWFLNRNGSKDFEGTFTIHTGQGDITQMGEIKFWKGMNHTGWYEGECGRLNGSTSDLFVPNEPLEKPLTIFITDTCRIINLEFTGEKFVIDGIEAWKYEATRSTFDNGQYNPNMKCYCPTNRQPDNCPATGATDLSPCSKGAPMYMSGANFLYADPSYTAATTGMEANYTRDNFFIIFERKLGVPLQVNVALQINLHIQRDDDITILRGINDFFAPLFVIASRAVISKELAKELRFALNVPSYGRYIGIALLCIGAIMIVTGMILTAKKKWYRQEFAPMN